MGNLIETNAIEGFLVYGTQMVDYTVAGEGGKDYSLAIWAASLNQVDAFEKELVAMETVLKARRTKLDRLGTVLAVLTAALNSMRTKDMASDDKSEPNNALITARQTMRDYGMDLTLVDGNRIRRREVNTKQADVEYSMDKEHNNLQQDMVTLQGLMNRRDKAYSTAAKIQKKVHNTSRGIIANM